MKLEFKWSRLESFTALELYQIIMARESVFVVEQHCPYQETDADCDGVTNVIDVVRFVNVAFRGGDAAVEFCEGCGQ